MASAPFYVKATDGEVTVFRASRSKPYVSAYFNGFGSTSGIAFSGKPGGHPCVAIDKAEYDRLVALKKQRTDQNSPQASWIYNAALAKAGA